MFKKISTVAALLGASLFLASCGAEAAQETETPGGPGPDPVVTPAQPEVGNDDDENGEASVELPYEGDHPLAAMDAVLAQFPLTIDTGDAIQGGHLEVALPFASPNPGILGGASIFGSSAADTSISGPGGTMTSIMSFTPSQSFGQNGLATFTFDVDERWIEFQLQYQAYWHDGVPLTLDDLLFAYEVIAWYQHLANGGIRFSEPIRTIVGIEDFHYGEADYISGIVLSDDHQTMRIYFNEFPPTHLYAGIWTNPLPRHIYGGYATYLEMLDSPYTRVHPIGWGPFRFENIVPGESVHFVANEDFVWGRPMLDSITISVIHPDLVPTAMVNGDFDVALDFALSQFPYFTSPDNFTYVGVRVGVYEGDAFLLGRFIPSVVPEDEDGEVIPAFFEMDYSRITHNLYLRRAMAYAVDQQAITELVWHGLRFPATSLVTPIHASYLDPTLRGYPFDPDRANELLDQAGFEWGPDGYRLDPDGNEFTLYWGHPEQEGADITTAFFIQQWGDVGIRVELFEGRLHDFAEFHDRLHDNSAFDAGMDMARFAWSPGFNPNPAGRWGVANSNRARFMTDEWDRILTEMGSSAAWDPEVMLALQFEMQQYFHDNVPAILRNWRIELSAVNNRVAFYTTDSEVSGGLTTWHRIAVNSETRH